MNKELLSNGFYRLTAPNGVQDIRTREIHSVVVCRAKNLRYFKAYEPEETE